MPLESFMAKAELSSSIPKLLISQITYIQGISVCLRVHASDAEKEKNGSFSFHDNMKESAAMMWPQFMTWAAEIDDCQGLTPHNVIT